MGNGNRALWTGRFDPARVGAMASLPSKRASSRRAGRTLAALAGGLLLAGCTPSIHRCEGLPPLRHPDPSGAVLYWPPGADDNARGLVLLIAAEGRRLLFPGDVEEDAEAWLAPRLPAVDVVKVAHHGSRTSSTAPFIAATAPSLAVISVGAGNPFGHPAPEVVARWAPTQVLRTDQNGTITLHIDDGAMSIQTSRGPPFETAHGD